MIESKIRHLARDKKKILLTWPIGLYFYFFLVHLITLHHLAQMKKCKMLWITLSVVRQKNQLLPKNIQVSFFKIFSRYSFEYKECETKELLQRPDKTCSKTIKKLTSNGWKRGFVRKSLMFVTNRLEIFKMDSKKTNFTYCS